MQRFIELLEAKVKPALVKTVPEAPGELKFFRRHTIKDILASFRQAGNDEMFNGKVVKVFPRKKNHFGNDTVDSIRAYESLNLEEGLKIPKGQIDFIVNKYHVGTPAKEIEDDIRKRATKSKTPWPSSMLNKAVEYAMKQHVKNQDLYGKVMSGDLSSPKKKKVSESVEVNEVLKKNLHKEVKTKKKHIYINGKWVGTSNYDHSNKEALQNYMKEHPGTHISKLKVAEEGVEINELSKNLLKNYVKRAAVDFLVAKQDNKDKNNNKMVKRIKGIEAASKKLHKESEINELSKSLLAKYTISSLGNKRKHEKEIAAFKPMDRWEFHDHKVEIAKREKGMKTAINKLVHESKINEMTSDLLKRYISKATDNMYKMDKEHVKDANYLDKKTGKRAKGIETANYKLHEETPFDKLKNKIEKKEGYSEEGAAGLAAKIGREKLGKKKFQAKAEAGKKKANESVVSEDAAKTTLKKFADSKGKMKPSESKDKVKDFIANIRKKKMQEAYEDSPLDNKRDKAGMKRTGKTKAEWENSAEDKKYDAKYSKEEKERGKE
jgi:hypothetical protein